MTLLTFSGRYQVQVDSATATSSSTFINDSYMTKTFSLTANKTVLVFYMANSVQGSTNAATGFKNAISVDGTDHSLMYTSGYAANYAMRNTCVWVGTLTAGSHTITGRFASNVSGSTTTITNRTLLILIFDGDEFSFVEAANTLTATGTSFITDSYSDITATPSGACKALAFYGATNVHGATERFVGKKVMLNIGGTDYVESEMRQSCYSSGNYADSVISAYALNLPAVSTVFQGKVACNAESQTATVNRRFTVVLFLSNSTVLDLDYSSDLVGTKSLTMVDDPGVAITRNQGGNLLTIYSAMKITPPASAIYGTAYGIMIDGTDAVKSRSSAAYTTDAHSCLVVYSKTVLPGDHIIKARYSANNAETTFDSCVSNRVLIALWLSPITSVEKSFETTNDIFIITKALETNDILTSKKYTSMADLNCSKMFSARSNELLIKSAIFTNKINLSKNTASTTDIRVNSEFSARIRLLISNAKVSYNNIKIYKKIFSSNSILTEYLNKRFFSTNDILQRVVTASSSDIRLSKLTASLNDIRILKIFTAIIDILRKSSTVSRNNIQTFKIFTSSSDIFKIISVIFSSSNNVHQLLDFYSRCHIKLYKKFQSSNTFGTAIIEFGYPLTVQVSSSQRIALINKILRSTTINKKYLSIKINIFTRTATTQKPPRTVTVR